MRFVFVLLPGTILLGFGALFLLTGHQDAGGFCVFFGILSFGSISYNNRASSAAEKEEVDL